MHAGGEQAAGNPGTVHEQFHDNPFPHVRFSHAFVCTVHDRYLAPFGRALPSLSPEELWFRMRGILAVVAVDRVEVYNRRTMASLSPVAGEAPRRWAITFLAAAMSAPPTGT
jgi:hypothetical protein